MLTSHTPTITPDKIIPLFHSAGFITMPLRGKKPFITGWQNSTASIPVPPDTNFGLILQDHQLILDVDPRNFPKGRNVLRELEEAIGLSRKWTEPTFVVRTGTGGYHIYLTKDPLIPIKKNLPSFPGIDFLSRGCQVVGPGSVHPDTRNPYLIVSGTPSVLLPAHDMLLEMLEAPVAAQIATEVVMDDDPAAIERSVSMIEAFPPAEEGTRGDSVFLIACRCRDNGLSVAKTMELVRPYIDRMNPPLSDEEVTNTVRHAYKYAKNTAGCKRAKAVFSELDLDLTANKDRLARAFDQTKNGAVLPTQFNCVKYLYDHKVAKYILYNEFTSNIEIGDQVPWWGSRGSKVNCMQDEDVVLCKTWLEHSFKVSFHDKIIQDSLLVISRMHKIHPVREYLAGLTWDRVPRIDAWLPKYCGVIDTPYTRAVSRKVLCGAVARVMHPGCKFDYMLILEGPQGIGKSQVCEKLAKNWGGAIGLNPHDKDTVLKMNGKWIIEIPELAMFRKADAESIKAFITTPCDRLRFPYARYPVDLPRQSLFIGTTNPCKSGYFSDYDNRRFWVVECAKHMDIAGLESVVDQLWAETLSCYESEHLYFENRNIEQIAARMAATKRIADPYLRKVELWAAANADRTDARPVEILEWAFGQNRELTANQLARMTQAVVDFGWVPGKLQIGTRMEAVFIRPEDAGVLL
jgi:predicted P-loop ATPase